MNHLGNEDITNYLNVKRKIEFNLYGYLTKIISYTMRVYNKLIIAEGWNNLCDIIKKIIKCTRIVIIRDKI